MHHYFACPKHREMDGFRHEMTHTTIKQLCENSKRNQALFYEVPVGKETVFADFSRCKLQEHTLDGLMEIAEWTGLKDKIENMFLGEKINTTEDRSVLHVALRQLENGRPEVLEVLSQIDAYTNKVRTGELKGATGKTLDQVVCIGIGGSYLGPEFVAEALKTDQRGIPACKGRTMRFLANVDPIDVTRALEGLDPERTLAVIISKTFTTAETILNAKTVRHWLVSKLGENKVGNHLAAVSTNLEATAAFGIAKEHVFGFWDWVGGRYSVCSAVGVLPLSLHFGYPLVKEFLEGCNAMDVHFRTTPLRQNLPVIMGLSSVWNSTYLGHKAVAVLPYCQALHRFAAHIQQLTMESNGKRVALDGYVLPNDAGEVFFGEPGTNGQHSFYQLIHQGQVVPCEFIGFKRSQTPITVEGEPVSNHDELMSNFFAQPDALAFGRDGAANNTPKDLVPHKHFPGDRPSCSVLMSECTPYTLGMLLALYEHRTAVQGFYWGLNSFDQWGVELGKVLAKEVRTYLKDSRTSGDVEQATKTAAEKFPEPTHRMLNAYLR